jgi:1-deoxy-D-xylulose-5-phosphate synthase
LKVRPMTLPDRFIDHNSPELQYKEAGLDAEHIVATVLTALGQPELEKPALA